MSNCHQRRKVLWGAVEKNSGTHTQEEFKWQRQDSLKRKDPLGRKETEARLKEQLALKGKVHSQRGRQWAGPKSKCPRILCGLSYIPLGWERSGFMLNYPILEKSGLSFKLSNPIFWFPFRGVQPVWLSEFSTFVHKRGWGVKTAMLIYCNKGIIE